MLSPIIIGSDHAESILAQKKRLRVERFNPS